MRSGALFFVAVVLLASCHNRSDPASTGSSAPAATPAAAYQEIAISSCLHEATCMHAARSLKEACRESEGNFLLAGYGIFARPRPSVAGDAIDLVAAHQCAQDFLRASCLELRPESCNRVFPAAASTPDPVPEGGACTKGRGLVDPATLAGLRPPAPACQNDLVCANEVCRPPGAAGEACVDDANTCQRGLFCEAGVCRGQRPEGSRCGEDAAHARYVNGDHSSYAKGEHEEQECQEALVCAGFVMATDASVDVTTGLRAGTCRPPSEAGERCAPPVPEDPLLWVTGCAAGLNCNKTGRCEVPPESGPCAHGNNVPCEMTKHHCDRASAQCVAGRAGLQ
jgi:hypothetical protein